MKRTLLAAALAALGTAAMAEPGYVTQGSGSGPVTSPFGLCWHSGDWDATKAAAPCDAVPRASTPPAPVARAAEPAPAPAPEPQAIATPAPRAPTLEKVTLSTDVLFDFNKAELKESGKQKLDELAGRVSDASVEEVQATGHADRIGTDEKNQKLSEARAQAVKDYLGGKVATQNIQAVGKGESEPVTGEACSKMGPEKKANRKLVDCLQPDRRVDIEVFGTRTASSDTGTAGTGGSAQQQR